MDRQPGHLAGFLLEADFGLDLLDPEQRRTFGEKVGDRLRQAQDSFNDARDKLSKNKGNVIRQAEMLKKLGVKPTKSLPMSLVESALDAESGEEALLEDQLPSPAQPPALISAVQ